jgi:hypothetical protein
MASGPTGGDDLFDERDYLVGEFVAAGFFVQARSPDLALVVTGERHVTLEELEEHPRVERADADDVKGRDLDRANWPEIGALRVVDDFRQHGTVERGHQATNGFADEEVIGALHKSSDGLRRVLAAFKGQLHNRGQFVLPDGGQRHGGRKEGEDRKRLRRLSRHRVERHFVGGRQDHHVMLAGHRPGVTAEYDLPPAPRPLFTFQRGMTQKVHRQEVAQPVGESPDGRPRTNDFGVGRPDRRNEKEAVVHVSAVNLTLAGGDDLLDEGDDLVGEFVAACLLVDAETPFLEALMTRRWGIPVEDFEESFDGEGGVGSR